MRKSPCKRGDAATSGLCGAGEKWGGPRRPEKLGSLPRSHELIIAHTNATSASTAPITNPVQTQTGSLPATFGAINRQPDKRPRDALTDSPAGFRASKSILPDSAPLEVCASGAAAPACGRSAAADSSVVLRTGWPLTFLGERSSAPLPGAAFGLALERDCLGFLRPDD